ncbi:CHAT domain-containing protein [Actinokineospora sp. 24-640]
MADDAAAVVGRCRDTLHRAANGGPAPQDVRDFLADLDRLPPDHPQRPRLAVTMVVTLIDSGRMAPLDLMLHLGALLDHADSGPVPFPKWPEIRVWTRAQQIMYAATTDPAIDVPTAQRTLSGLAEAAHGMDSTVSQLINLTRQILVLRSTAPTRGTVSDAISHMTGLAEQIDNPTTAEVVRRFAARFGDALAADRVGDHTESLQAVKDAMGVTGGSLIDVSGSDTVLAALADIELVHRGQSGGPDPDPGLIAELTKRADDTDAPLSRRIYAQAQVTLVCLERGEWGRGQLDNAIRRLRDLLLGVADSQTGVLGLFMLASALARRAEDTGDGLSEAEQALVRAVELMDGSDHQLWHETEKLLSRVRGLLGSRRPSGLDGLRRLAQVALVEVAGGARQVIQDVAAHAAGTARHHGEAGKLTEAFQTLESGRGLLIFAETAMRDIPAALREAGRADLASRWDGDDPDLRKTVVDALLTHDRATRGLLDPPTPAEARAALGKVGAAALVYLVPGDDAHPGYAVIVPAQGTCAYLRLPHLAVGEGTEAHRYIASPGDRVCDWAWRAAIGPVLERLSLDQPPRIVLVPVGDLARIAWQAARRGDGTHAVHLAAFSQVASARLFCTAAGRPQVALGGTGLVVSDPDTGACEPLTVARLEAHAVRRAFYPGARYVGRKPDGSPSRSGRGTPTEVADWLGDTNPHAGTTLHLACHNSFDAETGARALVLAPDDSPSTGRFRADQIVRSMAQTPQRAVGLVVLAAGDTVSAAGYDEVRSLSTAFLAGGAHNVISTMWTAPDDGTPAFVHMFHRFLRVHRMPPWQALRAAQMWMLDPARETPADLPGEIRTGPVPVAAWAGFTHSGQ